MARTVIGNVAPTIYGEVIDTHFGKASWIYEDIFRISALSERNNMGVFDEE